MLSIQLLWANHSASLMETKLFTYPSNSQHTIKRALSKMGLGSRAISNLKIKGTQEHGLAFYVTLDMIRAIVKPQEVLFKLTLPMAVHLQYQKLEKSSGTKLQLLTQNRFLQNFYGKWLTINMQLSQVKKVSMPQTQLMEPNPPRCALLGSQCGQCRMDNPDLKSSMTNIT